MARLLQETVASAPRALFQPQDGMSFCSLCPAGSFANKEGSQKCELCDYNTYSNSVGASYCDACDAGKMALIRGSIECVEPVPCSAGQQCHWLCPV